MAIIWGLDLREMQWSKFGSSYMVHIPRQKVNFLVQKYFRHYHYSGVLEISCAGEDLAILPPRPSPL